MKELSEIISHSIGGYSIANILSAILTLLVCLVVVRLVMKLFSRLLSRASRISDRLQKIILSCLKVLLYVLTAIITAESLGINTASLTAIMSVLTLGVTLAAEDILGNVAGGLVILSSHPFGIGDTIEAGGTAGSKKSADKTQAKKTCRIDDPIIDHTWDSRNCRSISVEEVQSVKGTDGCKKILWN